MQPDPVLFGKFQLATSENFEDFMARLGVSYLVRKLGNQSSPVVTVAPLDGNAFSIKQESLVSTSEIKFKLSEPFDEKTADGRLVKSTMSLEKPNTLKHQMLGTSGGKDSFCVREFFPDSMKCVCQVEEVITTRIYKRLA